MAQHYQDTKDWDKRTSEDAHICNEGVSGVVIEEENIYLCCVVNENVMTYLETRLKFSIA